LVAQRFVDRIRERRRLDPLPEDSSPAALPARPAPPDPDQPRYAAAMRRALGVAMAALTARDRLLLGCYYAQEMTLAQIGRLRGEHEATVSRHLARVRRAIRDTVEQRLRQHDGFGDREIAECFASVSADTGPINLGDWLDPEHERKKPGANRSKAEDLS
jgi:DNA-directed RNA polymerase specialized sigma24 family protein